MWKLLLVAFLARVSGAPTAPEPGINCFNLLEVAVGIYRCPPSPVSSNQNGSPINTNHQPVPFGVSNTGANFYQNFVFNDVIPSGRSSSDPPQAPKRDDYTYTPGVGAHKLNRGPVTWNAARKACNEDGGYLAIINSDEEARVLTEIFNNSVRVSGASWKNVVYLGFHNLYDKGDWVTIFGVSLADTGYKKWLPSQPNNFRGNQYCGSLDQDGGLNDVACTDVLPYFCELTNDMISPIDMNRQPLPFGVSNTGANFYQNFVLNGIVPSRRSNSDTPQAPKRDDYTYTPGVGAHKLNRKLLTWNAARKACNEEGGHLAIINSDEEAQLLAAMINNSSPVGCTKHEGNAYLGIHDLYDEGDWVTIFGVSLANTGFKKWSDESGNIQPNNYEDNQHCGTLRRNGGLNDVACEDILPYFCELTNV